jgi:hypothetical protein
MDERFSARVRRGKKAASAAEGREFGVHFSALFVDVLKEGDTRSPN